MTSNNQAKDKAGQLIVMHFKAIGGVLHANPVVYKGNIEME